MNRILVASALVLGFAGAAAAQEDVFIQGNYSASVLNQPTVAEKSAPVDRSPTASIDRQVTNSTTQRSTGGDLPVNTPAFPTISSGF